MNLSEIQEVQIKKGYRTLILVYFNHLKDQNSGTYSIYPKFDPRGSQCSSSSLTHIYYALCCQNLPYPRKVLVACLRCFFLMFRCLSKNLSKSEIVLLREWILLDTVIANSFILDVARFMIVLGRLNPFLL